MSESPEVKITRCAVYTRKSTEKGLEEEYNSLEAQRESAENYIKSQKHNGWQLIPEHYDDGGFSGGNTERPALKRLMADIKAGKVDVIVLYKIDRLSRSILDFMNMAEFFEQHNVSFVSVTQDINTSTSSGRMLLNILITFSQYEREIIGERILDRIAGAKRRGKYCGGVPVLGYDVNSKTKKLIINPAEAKIIKEVFAIYSRTGSGPETARIINNKGYRTKRWTSKRGKHHAGSRFTLKSVYRVLNNPLYIGKIHHNGNTYEGEQKAIIDMKLWDKVQHMLKDNCISVPGDRRRSIASPFKGLLVCGYCSGSFGITYTNKKNRRYMYYICTKDEARAERECPLSRFSAGNLDRIILGQLSRIFKNPSVLVKLCNELREREEGQRKEFLSRQTELESAMQNLREQVKNGGDPIDLRPRFAELNDELNKVKSELKKLGDIYSTRDLANVCGSIETVWNELFPAERYNLAHLLIDKVTLFSDHILMDIKHHGLKSLIKELKTGEDVKVYPSENNEIIRLDIPVIVKNWNGRKLVIAPGEDENPDSYMDDYEPTALAKRLAQAHRWAAMIESGECPTVAELSEELNRDQSNLMKAIKMVNLSPKIQKMIVEGNAPASLTLSKFYGEIPDDWEEQEQMFGFKQEEVSYV